MIVHVKLDPYDIYVGRPNKAVPQEDWEIFGNPYIVGVHGNRGECAAMFEALVKSKPQHFSAIKKVFAGKVLACWCAPKGGLPIDGELVCHAQVYARAARGDYDG